MLVADVGSKVVSYVKGVGLRLGRPSPERGKYKTKTEALFTLIGYSVGLGNLWRFPYLCHTHGGVTFLIPYVICLLSFGVPLYLLEQTLGQYVSLGPTHVYSFMCPLLSGVGWAMALTLLLLSIYYNVLLGWSIYYIADSIATTQSQSVIPPDTECTKEGIEKAYTYASTFFNETVLGGEGNTPYEVNWVQVGCLGGAWFLVVLFLARGTRNNGKLLYLTVLYPYLVLTCLWIMSIKFCDELNHFNVGLIKTPDLSLLLELDIWCAATSQVFYSLGVGLGGITAITSYNPFKHNFIRDGFLVCALDCVTAILFSFVVFSAIAPLADTLQMEGGESHLVFTAGNAFLKRIGTKPWDTVFFLMIFALGFNSQVMMMDAVTTILFDQFKRLRKIHLVLVGVTCGGLYLLGLPMCLKGDVGHRIFKLMDEYTCRHSLIFIALFEVFIAGHIYGFDNLMCWMREMGLNISRPLRWYLGITWLCITPVSLLCLLVVSLWSENWKKEWGDSNGTFVPSQIIAFAPALLLPGFALYKYLTRGKDTVKDLMRATINLCPALFRIHRDPVRENTNFPSNWFTYKSEETKL